MDLSNEHFTLENIIRQKENEIFLLEKRRDELMSKSSNKAEEFHYAQYKSLFNTKNMEDELIRKHIQSQINILRERYNYTTKEIITLKQYEQSETKKIEQIKNEIEEIKNPQPASSNTLVNLNTKATETKQSEKDLKDSEESKELSEQIVKNKNEVIQILQEIESLKKENERLDYEINNFNNDLSEKFTDIFKLELDLDKVKEKKRKDRSKDSQR